MPKNRKVAWLRKKDTWAEPFSTEYCDQWPRGTRSKESELVARPVTKPERRSVGVALFPGGGCTALRSPVLWVQAKWRVLISHQDERICNDAVVPADDALDEVEQS